jgi:hypothetical protein
VGTTFEDVRHDRITGSLTMFDRLIFKGHLTRLYAPGAVQAMLWSRGVPIIRFAAYVKEVTDALIAHAERIAAEAGRPSIYLARPRSGITAARRRTWPARSADELEALTWIAPDAHSADRAAEYAARAGIGRIRTLEVPGWEAAKRAASRGVGVTAISRMALTRS